MIAGLLHLIWWNKHKTDKFKKKVYFLYLLYDDALKCGDYKKFERMLY